MKSSDMNTLRWIALSLRLFILASFQSYLPWKINIILILMWIQLSHRLKIEVFKFKMIFASKAVTLSSHVIVIETYFNLSIDFSTFVWTLSISLLCWVINIDISSFIWLTNVIFWWICIIWFSLSFTKSSIVSNCWSNNTNDSSWSSGVFLIGSSTIHVK